MPSPGRRNTPPPPHVGSGSSSYRRQRSPDRRRKMEPTSRSAGSSRNISSSPSHRTRRPPVPSSRLPPEPRSRPRPSEPSAMPPGRNRSPPRTDTNGRTYAATHSGKRKASPKRDRETVRDHQAIDRSRPTPRKMMRSVSPTRLPSPRDIPLLPPSHPPPPPSRGYARSPVPIRSYSSSAKSPGQRGYGDMSVTLVSDTRSYSSLADVAPVGKSSSLSSRHYVGSSAKVDRRSPSEERTYVRTSAQKRATAHMTSHRFSDMHRDDEELLSRRSEQISHKPGLTDLVFNVSNEPKTKLTRDGHGVVRTILNPDSLQVVRRPALPARDAPTYNHNKNGWDSEDDDLDRSGPTWANPREGARPIFDRDEIKHQASLSRAGRDEELLDPHDRSPVQVARYVSSDPYHDVSRDSRNGQPLSRSLDTRSRPVVPHSRDIPSHSRDIPSHSRDIPSHSRDIPSHSRDAPRSRDVREEPSYSSRAGPSRDSYYEHEGRREYHSRGYEEEESTRGRHDNGTHRSVRRDDRDDLRHELELRRDPVRHSPERGSRGGDRSRDTRAESDSDLRVRINEKRSTRSTDRVFRERPDERSRARDRERRRSPSGERRRPPGDSYERKSRGEAPSSSSSRAAPRSSGEGYRDRSPPPPAAAVARYHEGREEYQEEAVIPWVADPEHVPRGNAYFEHDNREEGMVMVRGRGGYMHMRGFMSRGMRRPYRGSPMNRGGYVMLSRGPRRGFGPPRGYFAFRPVRPYAGFPIRRPFAPNLRRPSATVAPRRPSGPAVTRPPAPIVPVVPTPTSQS